MRPALVFVPFLLACGGADALDLVETRCGGALRYATPDDPAERGPWAVGARTQLIAGVTAEIWYPAPPGTDRDRPRARYDLREQLPAEDRASIPDDANPWLVCDCGRDLAFDEEHGPYPLVLFVHGTAGFRTQSLSFMTHWASRGFVVVAADHPLVMLRDVLQLRVGGDQAGEAARMLDAIVAGEVAFLRGRVATARIAIAGHSAGGIAIAGFASRPGALVLIPMAAGGVTEGTAAHSALILGAVDDGIVPWERQVSGFEATTTAVRRLVGLGNAGHLAFSELCALGREEGGLMEIAVAHGVEVPPLVRTLARDGCGATQLAPDRGWRIIQAATTAALEETLACSATATAHLRDLSARYPEVAELREALP